MKILIVTAGFYEDIAKSLLTGAIRVLDERKAAYDIVEVPGALEIPGAIAMAEKSGKYQGYVALGCVIRGETYHFDVVSNESARGLMQIALQGIAIGNGILTVENEAQAKTRSNPHALDKGGAAAAAALHMLAVKQQFEQE